MLPFGLEDSRQLWQVTTFSPPCDDMPMARLLDSWGELFEIRRGTRCPTLVDQYMFDMRVRVIVCVRASLSRLAILIGAAATAAAAAAAAAFNLFILCCRVDSHRIVVMLQDVQAHSICSSHGAMRRCAQW